MMMFAYKRIVLISGIFLFVLVLLDFHIAKASPWVQTNGPSGGVINTIEIDPENPDVLYAAGVGGGLFKTTDGGASWIMLEQIVDPSIHISDILISPVNPQTVYAVTVTGRLYKSSDGGEHLLMKALSGVTCVSMSPADPSILIAGTTEGEVHYSVDAGENWTDITKNPLPEDRIADIAIGATDDFWVGTANGSNGQVYHTTNAGGTWNEKQRGHILNINYSKTTGSHLKY